MLPERVDEILWGCGMLPVTRIHGGGMFHMIRKIAGLMGRAKARRAS
jgi:hypothetical protein